MYTILTQWFTDIIERANCAPNPSNTYRVIELAPSDTLPANPGDIHHLEKRYNEKFSALHVIKYTQSDLMYAINHISTYSAAPSAPEFQDIKHIICYLSKWHNHPIMYPSSLYVTATH